MALVPWSRWMADLSIAVRQVGDVAVLLSAGFINAHTVRGFEEALERLVQDGHYTILAQLQGPELHQLSRPGRHHGSDRNRAEHDSDVLLSNLQDSVSAIFDTLGFTQLYRVFGDGGPALAAAAPEQKGSAWRWKWTMPSSASSSRVRPAPEPRDLAWPSVGADGGAGWRRRAKVSIAVDGAVTMSSSTLITARPAQRGAGTALHRGGARDPYLAFWPGIRGNETGPPDPKE